MNKDIDNAIVNVEQNRNDVQNIDTSDWQTYRNEEFGFEFQYPKEWNIFNKSIYSYLGRENGKIGVGFTYDPVINGFEPKPSRNNRISSTITVDEYQKDYFENREKNILIPVLPQETWGCQCQTEEICYNLQEILINGKEAIKYNHVSNHVGSDDYGQSNYEAVAIKLNNNKILTISYSVDTKSNNKTKIETKKILSTVKIW